MRLTKYTIGKKTYGVYPVQSLAIERLLRDKKTEEANALIKQSAVEVVTASGKVEKEAPPPEDGGKAKQGATSTKDV